MREDHIQDIQVGDFLVRLGDISAQLYLQESEYFDDNTPDEWFLVSDAEMVDSCNDRSFRFLKAMDYVLVNITSLSDEATEKDYQTLFYDAAKMYFGEDKASIRDFFRVGYVFVFHSWSGPRWGQFVETLGVTAFIDTVQERLTRPIMMPLAL